jgi:hypothetical protein
MNSKLNSKCHDKIELETIPSADTISRTRTVSKLDPTIFRVIMTKLANDFLGRVTKKRKKGRPKKKGALPRVISLDGKTARGAVGPGQTKSEVHIVSAVCNLITMACMKVFEKSNEITAFPVILDILNKHGLVAGSVITIDAMGCQKNICELILKLKANYLFGLKGNHSGLHKEVEDLFAKGLQKYPNEFNSSSYTSPPKKARWISHNS